MVTGTAWSLASRYILSSNPKSQIWMDFFNFLLFLFKKPKFSEMAPQTQSQTTPRRNFVFLWFCRNKRKIWRFGEIIRYNGSNVRFFFSGQMRPRKKKSNRDIFGCWRDTFPEIRVFRSNFSIDFFYVIFPWKNAFSNRNCYFDSDWMISRPKLRTKELQFRLKIRPNKSIQQSKSDT